MPRRASCRVGVGTWARRRMTMLPATNLIVALEPLAPALHGGWR